MRGKFILAFSLLSSVLFLFSSCGMPTYHNFNYFSNTIQVSSSLSSVPGISTVYNACYRVRINNIDPYLAQINDASPAILVMYALAPNDVADDMISDFNTIYRGGSSRYYNGMPVSYDSNDGSLENISASENGNVVEMFRFTGDGNTTLSSSPHYTWNNNGSGLLLDKYYYFAFRNEPVDDQSFNIIMDVYERSTASSSNIEEGELNPVSSVLLKRANGESFPQNYPEVNDPDFSFYSNNDDTYTINLFLTVNILPGNASEFNNIYWYELRITEF